jgi:ABC-type branched-subunit amino acid transport system substrate-binding protein
MGRSPHASPRHSVIVSSVVSLALVVTAGCSVSRPRHGSTVYGSNAGPAGTSQQLTSQPAAGAAGGTDGGSAGGAGTAPPSATTVGGSGTAGSGTGSAGTPNVAVSTSTPGGPGMTSGNGGSTDVGVSATSIKIAWLLDDNGVYQAFFDNYFTNGVQAWVSDVNGRGGIYGRKVQVDKIDDGSSSAGGKAACQRVADGGYLMAVAVLGLGGADVAEADCLDQKHIPFLIVHPSAVNTRWTSVHTVLTPVTYGAPFAGFIRDVLHDSSRKVGVIYATDQLNTAKGKAFIAAARGLGMQVHAETYAPNETNFAAQDTRMAQSGATSVAFFGGIEYLSAKKEADSLNYLPHWVGSEWAADDTVAACRSCYQGQTNARWWSAADSPGYRHFQQVATKYGYPKGSGDTKTTVASYYGIGVLTEQVLRNAGARLLRTGVNQATERLGHYNNGIVALTFQPGAISATPLLWPVACCSSGNTWYAIGAPKPSF